MNAAVQKIFALLTPLLVAFLLTGFIPVQRDEVDERLQLQLLTVSSAAELEAAFDSLGYVWPPQSLIPPVELSSLPHDLAQVSDVKQKKALFFRALLPIVLAENETVMELRQHILQLYKKGVMNLEEGERRWLDAMAKTYKIKDNIVEAKTQRTLLARVDIVPEALVLAQAANESAWGTSRFARLGNNLFGQWTYRQSEGIVPLGRPEGATYAVRAFPTIDASVRAYIQNLNTNPAYAELRLIRQQMRDTGQPLDAYQLATGLMAYSERGEEYVHEIQAMMRTNRLMILLESVSLKRETEKVSLTLQALSTAG
jgi:Bax protein